MQILERLNSMNTFLIHKHALKITDLQTIQIPIDSKILSAENQNGQICIWYQFDAVNQNVNQDVKIQIIGTGNPFTEKEDEDRIFLNTVIQSPFVWHVFIIKKCDYISNTEFI